jgi:Peptidase family M28
LTQFQKFPLDELRALGLTIAIDAETAAKSWIELMRIDAEVKRVGPYVPARSVRAAYQAIAHHIVKADTPDQILEELIPQLIFFFHSERDWARYGKLEFLCSILEPCIIEWKATKLELARVLGMSDVRTNRSVRFIFWNNEEFGMDGSATYAR